jgi:hypothetical protein
MSAPAPTRGVGRLAGLIGWARRRWPELALGSIAALPIVVAAVRAIAVGSVAINDDALILMRTRDVLTANHPWLGTVSSASLTLGVVVSHPGPIMLDLMAVPVRVLGSGPGLIVGVSTLNLVCLLAAATMAHRIAGRRGYVLALLVGSSLAWSMGSALLHDVWQPHALVLVFLLLLVLAWSLAAGRLLVLPWAGAVASLLVQTHVAYTFLAPTVVLAGLAVALLTDRGAWRRLGAPVAWAGGVVLLAWAQPLWQNWAGPGPGNLGRLVGAATGRYGASAVIGIEDSLRYTAAVVALPPWILRPSFGATLAVGPIPPVGVAGAAVTCVALLLLAVIGTSRGRSRRTERDAGIVALVALTVGLVALARQPASGFGFPAPHQMRWLWPLGAFVVFALLLRITVAWRERTGPLVALGAVVVLVSVANLPAHADRRVQPDADVATPAARRLIARTEVLRGRGVLRYDTAGERFGQPFGAVLMQSLAERGIPFVVNDRWLGLQAGPARQYRGCDTRCGVRTVVTVRTGTDAWRRPPGSQRVIFVPGVTSAELATIDRLERRLEASGARITRRGTVRDAQAGLAVTVDRYEELRRRRDLGSVAVLVRPLP